MNGKEFGRSRGRDRKTEEKKKRAVLLITLAVFAAVFRVQAERNPSLNERRPSRCATATHRAPWRTMYRCVVTPDMFSRREVERNNSLEIQKTPLLNQLSPTPFTDVDLQSHSNLCEACSIGGAAMHADANAADTIFLMVNDAPVQSHNWHWHDCTMISLCHPKNTHSSCTVL